MTDPDADDAEVAVTLTEDGPVRIRGNGVTWERGETKTVSAERADALTETHAYFELADEIATAETETADSASDEFDVDSWLDLDYGERADQVEAGEVDAHLDAIADAETSDTVLDAVGMRRAELEE